MSTQQQRTVFYMYVLNRRTYLEKDIETRKNNIRWSSSRGVDAVDLLELALSQERLNEFNEVVKHIEHIFQLHSAADLLERMKEKQKSEVD